MDLNAFADTVIHLFLSVAVLGALVLGTVAASLPSAKPVPVKGRGRRSAARR